MKKVLVTGAAGFVGSHLCEHILKNTDWSITCLDRFDASGNPNRLSEMLETTEGIDRTRIRFIYWDLRAELNEQVQSQLKGPFDLILHLAAGSHVDRSIDEPLLFFQDNCIGTVNLLNYAKSGGLVREENFTDDPMAIMSIAGRFLYFSTDEVYGPAPEFTEGEGNTIELTMPYDTQQGRYHIEQKIGKIIKIEGLVATIQRDPSKNDDCVDRDFCMGDIKTVSNKLPFPGFKEWDRLNPNNPYAAAKAAAEMAVIAYANTYGIPCLITNTMNIFGERQNPEKFIPLVIKRSITGERLFIHANKDKTQAGKRHYLHARNICAATVWAAEHGKLLDGSAKVGRYNIVGDAEVDNLTLAQLIHDMVADYYTEHNLGAIPPLAAEMVDFHSSRPGHDLRYALTGDLIKSEGFNYPVEFEPSLRKNVYWTLDHADKWL